MGTKKEVHVIGFAFLGSLAVCFRLLRASLLRAERR